MFCNTPVGGTTLGELEILPSYGGTLFVKLSDSDAVRRIPREFQEKLRDNFILATILDVKAKAGDTPTGVCET